MGGDDETQGSIPPPLPSARELIKIIRDSVNHGQHQRELNGIRPASTSPSIQAMQTSSLGPPLTYAGDLVNAGLLAAEDHLLSIARLIPDESPWGGPLMGVEVLARSATEVSLRAWDILENLDTPLTIAARCLTEQIHIVRALGKLQRASGAQARDEKLLEEIEQAGAALSLHPIRERDGRIIGFDRRRPTATQLFEGFFERFPGSEKFERSYFILASGTTHGNLVGIFQYYEARATENGTVMEPILDPEKIALDVHVALRAWGDAFEQLIDWYGWDTKEQWTSWRTHVGKALSDRFEVIPGELIPGWRKPAL